MPSGQRQVYLSEREDWGQVRRRCSSYYHLASFFSDILLSVEHTNLCLYSIIQNLFLDSLVCPKGSYGVRCAQRCRCFDNAHCDPVEGTCQCPAGRTGEYCQEGKLAKNTRERSYVYEVKLK